MAAYAHASWATCTDINQRVTELDAHIAEVSASISAAVSANGQSRDPTALVTYHQNLLAEREKLANQVGVTAAGGRGRALRSIRLSGC